MRTRRILAALLCLGVMAVSIGGCAGKKEETPKDTQAVAESAAEEKETAVKNTDFPKKNIKIIVPYAAGGGVDIT
ncbi:MAG: tripartite tricarboxylate transporter substrate binding protein, partial [Oribacterium parvum]|nr:tripartite tricarboxylate transporter substrate binding protein [Oribacterium parvum]